MSIFTKVSIQKPKQSTFNMSYDRKFSLNMGGLYPCHIQEVLPGDKFTHNTQQMMRMAPMISPVMHEVNVYTHYFFVPNRIMWDNWEKFITGGEDGLDTTLFPTIVDMEVQTGSLADYLGLPITDSIGGDSPVPISILPFIAYNMIYNEYYRDQNLIDPINLAFTDGANDYSALVGQDLFSIKRRAWQHDYFTSALPFAQKGNPVQLPLVNTAGQYLSLEFEPQFGDTKIVKSDGSTVPGVEGLHKDGNLILGDTTGHSYDIDVTQNTRVPLDGLQDSSATINDLRRAFKVQEWCERQMRAGARLFETILSHFGVKTSDGRLQRPEFLGGGMSPMLISEVLQTSQTDNESPQGNMAGHGLGLGRNHSYSRFFEEHGYIIGIVSVMPKTAYQQGIPKHFSKFDKFDYGWPLLEHIGEQEIRNKEICLTDPSVQDPDGVFGYIPRYAEYKFNPSTVHGDFKDTLDFWHMGRIFDPVNPPVLNKEFVESSPTRRIFAVEDSPEGTLYCHMFHNIQATRKLSYFSDPLRL